MKNFFYLVSIIVFTACSSGGDDAPEKSNVTGTISVMDPSNRIEGESIFVGLFANNQHNTPIYKTQIAMPQNTSDITFSLNNVESGDYTCKVYVAAHNGNVEAVLHTYTQVSYAADVRLPLADIKLLSYSRVQEQVFNSCIQCHGGTQLVEAGLYLTADKSYAALVGIKSQSKSNETLVVKNDAGKSFIMTVLNQKKWLRDIGVNAGSEADHTAASSFASEADKLLIEKWINNGAKND